MARGMYLSLGLNSVDPIAYKGWSGMLIPCETDASDVAAIAESRGCAGTKLLTADATSVNVLTEIDRAAKALKPGDFFLLYYSGHGSNVGDVTGEEEDSMDETWCLFDRMLIDDELYSMWSRFAPGTRILVLSDSCHSGTVTKNLQYVKLVNDGVNPYAEAKVLPLDKAWPIYIANKDWYDGIQIVAGASEKAAINASVILISGCQDNQLSLAGDPNSVFTQALKDVWDEGRFVGGYRKFHSSISGLMPPTQSPNYYLVGATNMEFEASSPFSV